MLPRSMVGLSKAKCLCHMHPGHEAMVQWRVVKDPRVTSITHSKHMSEMHVIDRMMENRRRKEEILCKFMAVLQSVSLASGISLSP